MADIFVFFVATFAFLVFLISLLREKVYCKCDVCKSYLNGTWRKEHENLCDWYSHLLKESPRGTIHVHALNNVITSNPDNVKHILRTNFSNYPKGKPFSAILGDLLGHGIFNVDGHRWMFQRKVATLELGSVSIRNYAFHVINTEIQQRLLPLLSSSPRLDFQDVFKRFSFDNICKFSFGVDPSCLGPTLPDSQLATAFDVASTLSARRALYPFPIVWKLKRLLNVGSERTLREAILTVKRAADGMIRNRRAQAQLGSASHNDLLSRFMATTTDDVYLRDIVISFLLAGRDSVASALTSTMCLLSRNHHVMEAIREEVSRIIGDDDSAQASLEQLKQMHYLNGVVYETLRLLPPVQFDSKFAENDDVLADGTLVKAGTRVTYHQYAMGRAESIWGPDWAHFRPERWLEEGRFVPRSPFVNPVFNAGYRTCLGMEMALIEIKAAALAIVRNFDFRVDDPIHVIRFDLGLTATLRGGLPMLLQPRKERLVVPL